MNSRRPALTPANLNRIAHKEIVGHADAYVYTARSGRLQRLHLPCFFLRSTERGLRVVEVTREAVESMFKDLKFGFPANVHRRFVSGELLDGMIEEKASEDHAGKRKWNGVAPELVDWWMSHWGVGEEPWNKSSSLSLEAYKRGIEEPLSKLLKDLGFRPKRTALVVEGIAEL